MRQQFVHAHMLHIIHIQLWKPACDIVDQDITPAHNAKFIGCKALFVIVHNIRNPMHCHCRLSTSCDTLHNDIVKWTFPYDLILFFLDCGNNISQHSIAVFAQVLHQQLIICRHITVIKALHTPLFDVIGPFQA